MTRRAEPYGTKKKIVSVIHESESERANRQRVFKAHLFADIFEEYKIAVEDVPKVEQKFWDALAERLGKTSPSEKTKRMVVRIMTERRELRAAVQRAKKLFDIGKGKEHGRKKK